MEKNKKVSKIPNMITNARLLFLPVLLFFILVPMQSLGITYVLGYYFPVQIIIALCLFILLALTDFLDGYLARKLNAITEYGKYMDPILDKILVLATLIALTSIGLAPAWIVIVILVREIMVSAYRYLILANNGKVVAANKSGKIKTATTMVWIILLFLSNYPFEVINIPVTEYLGYFVVLITVYSGYEIFAANKLSKEAINE